MNVKYVKKKLCTACGDRKLIKFFDKNSHRKDGLSNICKGCKKERNASWYQLHKTEVVDRVVQSNKVRKEEKRKKIESYLLEHPCVDCGEKDPIVLDFDHVRGTKKANVSFLVQTGHTWETVAKEIEKCDVRCANCHRRKTIRNKDYESTGFHSKY